MITDNKHNGWTNYATWRINLEIFSDMNISDFSNTEDAYNLSKELREYAEEAVTGFGELEANSLAVSYALAFLAEVDWTEIAESMIENDN